MEVKIYSLIDPRTNIIRYVGKTIKSLEKRLKEHLYLTDTNKTHKANWIRQLKKLDLIPIIKLIEICNENDWIEREKYWIRQYNNLTNLTTGGEGVNYFVESVRKVISDKVKLKWLEPEFRFKMINNSINYWSIKENRIKHSEKTKGSKITDKHKEIISNTRKKEWENPEYREKMCLQSKNLWLDENYKTKVLSFLQSNEHKEAVSKRFKNKKLSNEHKEKMSKSAKNKKKIIINDIEYESITNASKTLGLNRDLIKGRLRSKKFTNYKYKEV